jgi:hypothetical protein
VVFWFWVTLFVLAIPPVAYGLVMAALLLLVRQGVVNVNRDYRQPRRSMWWWGGLW